MNTTIINCPLTAKAQELWPNNPAMQQKWLAAVRMVRETPNGWLLDTHVQKKQRS